MFVGAPDTFINQQGVSGVVYFYTGSSGNWLGTPYSEFDNPSPVNVYRFGAALSVSANGNTLLVGAPGFSGGGTQIGYVYIYNRINGAWETSPSASVEDPAQSGLEGFGISVAISSNANTMLVGAPFADENNLFESGKAYLFNETVNGNWTPQQTLTFTNPDPIADAWFGYTVALSQDGTTAFIGAPGGNVTINGAPGDGEVLMFVESNGQWVTSPNILLKDPGNEFGDGFGTAISVSADATTLLVGAPYASLSNQQAGNAYIFSSSSSSNSGGASSGSGSSGRGGGTLDFLVLSLFGILLMCRQRCIQSM